jgi:hypothetical protein
MAGGTGKSASRTRRPAKKDLPAGPIREFRDLLEAALTATDENGRKWADAQWGCYAFYDYDAEPIYVGQTNERLRTRIRRHLTNQRTDAVAMRILDVFEVAEMKVWPLWDLQGRRATDREARAILDATEYTAYREAIEASNLGAILNEKIPPVSPRVLLPPSMLFPLASTRMREERGHPDVRIARRAEGLARLAAVVHERGEVSDGLRRVEVIQAVRLAYLAACRLAHAEGRPDPDPSAINLEHLIGSVLREPERPD